MDPYLVEVARTLPSMSDRAAVEEALDKLEYLYDALDPIQQEAADEIMEKLRARLSGLAG